MRICEDFEKLKQSFELELARSSDLVECHCCHQLLPEKNLRILSTEKAFNKDLVQKFFQSENLDKKKHHTLRLCTSYCYQFFESKNNSTDIPKFSKIVASCRARRAPT